MNQKKKLQNFAESRFSVKRSERWITAAWWATFELINNLVNNESRVLEFILLVPTILERRKKEHRIVTINDQLQVTSVCKLIHWTSDIRLFRCSYHWHNISSRSSQKQFHSFMFFHTCIIIHSRPFIRFSLKAKSTATAWGWRQKSSSSYSYTLQPSPSKSSAVICAGFMQATRGKFFCFTFLCYERYEHQVNSSVQCKWSKKK